MENTKSRVDNIPREMCTGCSACLNICPVDAISMESDLEGFLYPAIDNDKCINCGKCYEICPVINRKNTKNEYPQKLYFAILRDTEIRKASSSGGAFTALALATFSDKGYVAGVAYDEDY